ncbi:MAG: hypothetical protein QN178_04085 [Armatimonadota bacterium]|nr:hypothetical protein [Armatimonadota bacterium]
MRSTKLIVIPVLVALAAALLASPAAAQTYIALRYWPSQTNVSLSGAPGFRAYDSNLISLSVRRMLPQAPWSLSLNLDTGSNANLAGTWTGGTNSGTTYWNANLHRDFRGENTNLSVFLGYQSARTRTTFGTEQASSVNGLRAGADLLWRRGAWSVMAWGAVGLSPRGETTQPGFASASGTGTYSEYGAILGYTISGWGVEAGYRWLNFGVPGGGSFLPATFRTSGFTVGLSRSW